MASEHTAEFRMQRARTIKSAMQNKKWNMAELARRSLYDEKTIRKLLAGDNSKQQTVIDICEVLEIPPILPTNYHNQFSEECFGSYSRAAYSNYEGYYYMYRNSFHDDGTIVRVLLEMFWHDESCRLVFREFYDSDLITSSQGFHLGDVYISSYTGLVHLVTVFRGAVRTITLTKMRYVERLMRGTISTQSERINFFKPTISPVVLSYSGQSADNIKLDYKVTSLNPGSGDYNFAKKHLEITESEVINIRYSRLK